MMQLVRILVVAGLCCWSFGVAAQPSGPNANIPMPPETLRRRMQDDPFEITAVAPAGGGVMGASKITMRFLDDSLVAEAKWKAAPQGGDGWNNSPRREVGAYAVQQWFLDSDDYVVPPVAARCIALDVYRPIDAAAAPNLPGTRCVFGLLSAWLSNVQVEPALQRERFSHDPRYAYHFANLNLLAYLIAHRDARTNNFLMSSDPTNPQVFSVDNGIAFGGVLYNFFTWHFDQIAVGGLPKRSIDRLRNVKPSDLTKLAVLGEFRAGPNGVLRPVLPSATTDARQGARQIPGGIQFGLTTEEIDGIAARLRELLERIDRGEMQTF
jgi:hypothetical protein